VIEKKHTLVTYVYGHCNISNIQIKHLQHMFETTKIFKHTLATCVYSHCNICDTRSTLQHPTILLLYYTTHLVEYFRNYIHIEHLYEIKSRSKRLDYRSSVHRRFVHNKVHAQLLGWGQNKSTSIMKNRPYLNSNEGSPVLEDLRWWQWKYQAMNI
jgi:hypothetical protein